MNLFTLASGFKSLVEGLMRSFLNTCVRLKRILVAWRWLLLAIFIFFLCLFPSLGQGNPAPQGPGNPVNVTRPNFTLDTGDNTASVSRGTSIRVSGNSSLEAIKRGSSIQLELSGKDQSKRLLATSDSEKSLQTFEFIISDDIQIGEYSPRLLIVEDGEPVKIIAVDVAHSTNNMLAINGNAGSLQPVIASVFPAKVIFPSNYDPRHERTYSFKVFGSGFSLSHSDNHLELYSINNDRQDQSTALLGVPAICWHNNTNQPIQPCQNKSVIGKVISSRQLLFENLTFDEFANDVNGEQLGIAIRVGDNSSEVKKITVSRVPYSAPLWWAIIGLFVVVAVVLAILSNSRKGKLPPSLLSLIIDPDTNTYSLSKFQFVLWTSVAILSYLFLFLSKSLAQGKLEFIDIPSGLPAIVLASAATTFFAIGIDNTKGGKGSGPEIEPVWSDLISAGGNVLPDRLQFFAWTIIGVFVYAFTVLSQNPGVISDLPIIPPGFLQLSGVSAVGYLGGKLVRAPGPVIATIDIPAYEGGFLTLTLNGKNLSKDASLILIDFYEKTIRIPQDIGLALGSHDQDKGKAIMQIIDGQAGDPTMASKLKIQIPAALDQWQFRDNLYSITLANPDTQIAAGMFVGLKQAPPSGGDQGSGEGQAGVGGQASGGTEPGQAGGQGGGEGQAGAGG
jgi:hypothetical protein